MLCFHVAQHGKHLLRTQNVSEQNQKHFLCPRHEICVRNKIYLMLRARKNGEIIVSATMRPQQCVLVCQGLIKRGSLPSPALEVTDKEKEPSP